MASLWRSNDVYLTVLISTSLVLASVLVGIYFANLIPTSSLCEVSFAVGVGLILTFLAANNSAKSKQVELLEPSTVIVNMPEELLLSSRRDDQGGMILSDVTDDDSLDHGGLDSSPLIDERHDESDQNDSTDSSSIDSSCRTTGSSAFNQDGRPHHTSLTQESALASEVTSSKDPNNCGPDSPDLGPVVDERVTDLKRRLLVRDEPARVKTAANYLRFQDSQGEIVRYAVRNSRKRPTAVLEIILNGHKPKKIKELICDQSSRIVFDGKNEFMVPPEDFANVTKSLNLLCKVASVPFECKVASE